MTMTAWENLIPDLSSCVSTDRGLLVNPVSVSGPQAASVSHTRGYSGSLYRTKNAGAGEMAPVGTGACHQA